MELKHAGTKVNPDQLQIIHRELLMLELQII